MKSKYSRGEGKLGCIVWLIVLSIGGVILFRAFPTKIAVSELKDHCVDVIIAGAYATEEDMAKNVLARAKDLKLPVAPADIVVTKTNERIVMDVKFTVTYDLVVTKMDSEVNIHEDRPYFK